MRIGVPKEIKNHEYRVGLPPAGVVELVNHGHEVMIETHAGEGAGFSNEDYVAAGATIADAPTTIFAECDLIVKVKEPQPDECRQLRPGQLLFTYLHLAADRQQTDLLMESGATCIAYETVEGTNGGLPLLAPMSEIAGRLAAQAGGDFLKKSSGGRGVLLGGVVGTNAARVAQGMGARVVVLDRSLDRLRYLDDIFMGRIETVWSSAAALEEQVMDADLIIGAVLIPGAAAPKLVSRDLVSKLQKGSVMVDVAIDQGGCFETSHATSYQDPTYEVDGVVHYCVANMPGGVARTATLALTNATLPYVVRLADQGQDALRGDARFALGLNVHAGKLTHAGVGEAFSLDAISPAEALTS